MTKKKPSPSVRRARARQADGDPRPYMVILHEEQVREAKRTGTVRVKPTQTLKLPPDVSEEQENTDA